MEYSIKDLVLQDYCNSFKYGNYVAVYVEFLNSFANNFVKGQICLVIINRKENNSLVDGVAIMPFREVLMAGARIMKTKELSDNTLSNLIKINAMLQAHKDELQDWDDIRKYYNL